MSIGVAAWSLLLGIGATTAVEARMPATERGYPAGALGLAAIQRGDWERAEAQIAAASPELRNDPAALINLGEIYYRTGRIDLARQTWQAAHASPTPHEVLLRSGRVLSTRDVAAIALRRVSPEAVAKAD